GGGAGGLRPRAASRQRRRGPPLTRTLRAHRFGTGQRNLQVVHAASGRVAGTARYSRGRKMLRTLFSATILAGALAGSAMAQAPDAGCALPSEPKDIPAAIDAAISGPADKDRACMKALLIPEARMMFASLGADGAPTYTLQTLDEWIARVKARGHVMLEEKQLKFHIERYSNIALLWSSYALYSDGKQVARGI